MFRFLFLPLLLAFLASAEDLSIKPDYVLVHRATITSNGATYAGEVVLVTQELALVSDTDPGETIYLPRPSIKSVEISGNTMRLIRKNKTEVQLVFTSPDSVRLVSGWLGVDRHKSKKK